MKVGLYGLQSQNAFGDFHLKTIVGIVSGECLIFLDYLTKKAKLMNLSLDEEYYNFYQEEVLIEKNTTKMSLLFNLIQNIENSLLCFKEIKSTQDKFWWDSNFFWQTEQATLKLKTYLRSLKEWQKICPSETRNLQSSNGLLRDCDIFEVLNSNREETIVPRSLKEKDLLDPQLKAAYICGNAYLEITSIDILSDLIIQVMKDKSCSFKPWIITSLAHQIIDECQHAEMLSERLNNIGFELGMTSISLNTWNCYKSFKSLPEKVIAQQIVQEGVGLDSSALNIKRFKKIEDMKSCLIYQKITVDELNHVTLGVNILNNLVPDQAAVNEMFFETKKRVLRIDPFLPKVPVSVELKRKTGMPKEWI